MEEITLRRLQQAIDRIEHREDAVELYFYKLSEEVGELAKALRQDARMTEQGGIKGTVEEELFDVLYYVVCLANRLNIDLEDCARLKEEVNARRYGRKNVFEEPEKSGS